MGTSTTIQWPSFGEGADRTQNSTHLAATQAARGGSAPHRQLWVAHARGFLEVVQPIKPQGPQPRSCMRSNSRNSAQGLAGASVAGQAVELCTCTAHWANQGPLHCSVVQRVYISDNQQGSR